MSAAPEHLAGRLVVLAGDTSTVHVVTTPASGSGEPVLEYSREFERRSGRVQASAE